MKEGSPDRKEIDHNSEFDRCRLAGRFWITSPFLDFEIRLMSPGKS